MNLHDTPTPRHTIYILTEETRWGTDQTILNVPQHVDLYQSTFYFDTHNDPDPEQVQEDIDELKLIMTDFPASPGLLDMIQRREDWLAERAAENAADEEADAEVQRQRLAAARQLLRDAGELP